MASPRFRRDPGGAAGAGDSVTANLLRELIEAQTRFPSFFDEIAESKALFQLDGALAQANGATFALLGFGQGESLAGPSRVFGSTCDQALVCEAFAKAAAGSPAEVSTILAADDRAIAVTVRLAPAIVDDTIVGVHATIRSVTPGLDAQRTTARKMRELSSLFERHGDALIALDPDGCCGAVNPAFERLTGYTNEEFFGRSYAPLIAADERPRVAEIFRRTIEGESVVDATAIVDKTGRRVEVAGMAVPILVNGTVVGMYAVFHDVTDERLRERAANEQTERMRELYLVAASTGQTAEAQIRAAIKLGRRRLDCVGGYLTRIEGDTVTFVCCTGDVSFAEGAQIPLADSVHARVVAATEPLVLADEGDAGAFIGTRIVVAGLDFGTLCFVWKAAHPQECSELNRDFVRLVGALAASAIERGDQRRRLDELAFFDALTGLPNRVLLHDRLLQAIANATRDGTTFAVHFYDLDGFKAINDDHGHLRGDDVLRIIGSRIETVAREVDTLARMGGDEFVVVQPGVHHAADAARLAGRLRKAIAKPVVVDGREHRLTASAGIALFPRDGKDAETLLARADAALYRVKASGRDAIAFVNASDAWAGIEK